MSKGPFPAAPPAIDLVYACPYCGITYPPGIYTRCPSCNDLEPPDPPAICEVCGIRITAADKGECSVCLSMQDAIRTLNKLNTHMKYPHILLDGKTYDIYDIAEACGVTSPPLFNAFKKIIRRGNGAKTERQDLEEVKQSVDRYLKDKP